MSNLKPCKDHRGNQFISITEMCRLYGVDVKIYRHRIKIGWTIEEALTSTHARVEDHEGHKFTTVKEMCKYWGISYKMYYNRTTRFNWSLEKTLTTPQKKSIKCKDHTGKEFQSIQDMCTYWGVDYGTYQSRVCTLKWPVGKALTTPINEIPTITVFNKTFKGLSNLCDEFHVAQSTYVYRIKSGWSQEEALGLIPRIKPSSKNLKINDSILIKEPIKTDSDIQYYSCDWNGEDAVMTRDIILNKARASLAETYA